MRRRSEASLRPLRKRPAWITAQQAASDEHGERDQNQADGGPIRDILIRKVPEPEPGGGHSDEEHEHTGVFAIIL